MQSTTRLGRPENGGLPVKARPVRSSRMASGPRFMFVRVTLGRSASSILAMPHNSSLIVREGDTCAANVEAVYAILLRSKVIPSKRFQGLLLQENCGPTRIAGAQYKGPSRRALRS